MKALRPRVISYSCDSKGGLNMCLQTKVLCWRSGNETMKD